VPYLKIPGNYVRVSVLEWSYHRLANKASWFDMGQGMGRMSIGIGSWTMGCNLVEFGEVVRNALGPGNSSKHSAEP
jgi:hypothetical protein